MRRISLENIRKLPKLYRVPKLRKYKLYLSSKPIAEPTKTISYKTALMLREAYDDPLEAAVMFFSRPLVKDCISLSLENTALCIASRISGRIFHKALKLEKPKYAYYMDDEKPAGLLRNPIMAKIVYHEGIGKNFLRGFIHMHFLPCIYEDSPHEEFSLETKVACVEEGLRRTYAVPVALKEKPEAGRIEGNLAVIKYKDVYLGFYL